MWIYEMMMISPLAFRSSTTGETVIFEHDDTDDLLRIEWTLEPYLPSSSPIDISSEIDEISWIRHSDCRILNDSPDHIDQISLPDSSEFEFDSCMKHNLISIYFYIAIVSCSIIARYTHESIVMNEYSSRIMHPA